MTIVDANELSIVTVGNNVSLMSGVEAIKSTFTSTTDINDTLLPTITIDGTLTSGNNVSLMSGVDINVLSIATVGNNVSLMPDVDVNVLSIVTVGNNVSLMSGSHQ
jgi:acetyltransferase-like isoleucine patch superfamily enzyme